MLSRKPARAKEDPQRKVECLRKTRPVERGDNTKTEGVCFKAGSGWEWTSSHLLLIGLDVDQQLSQPLHFSRFGVGDVFGFSGIGFAIE